MTSENNDELEHMIDLARDPRFEALRARAKEAPLSWGDFKLLPMPHGYDPERVWELLNILRRHTAITVPYADGARRRGWYSITNSMLADCGVIDQRCCRQSWLDTILRSHDPYRLQIESVVNETTTVLASDGVSVGYEEARGILDDRIVPETDAQQIVSNVFDVMYDTPALAKGSIDERLILDLRKRLTEHVVDEARLFTGTPEHRAEARAFNEDIPWEGPHFAFNEVLAKVVDIANGVGVDPAEHPLLLSLGIDGVITPSRPFAELNNTVSWLISRILLTQRGLPVLAYIPVHYLVEQWRLDLRKPNKLGMSRQDSIVMVDGTVDFTGHLAGVVELVRDDVLALEDRMRRIVERESDLSGRIAGDERINYRQQALIQQALRDPASVFRIATHQRAFHIVYATARLDLCGLADLGLFDCTREGRAFVFTPRPDLERLVARMWP